MSQHRLHTIGLTGLSGVGKDTAADLLCTHAGFTRLAFADTLRAEVCAAFGIEPLYLIRRECKATPMDALCLHRAPAAFRNAILAWRAGGGRDPATPDDATTDAFLRAPRTPRQIMQWWGTEYRRACDGDHYWVKCLAQRVHHLRRELRVTRIVITDVRFLNEAAWLRDQPGARLWRITRPGITTTAHSGEGPHTSATDGAHLRPDATLHNSHTIGHLQGLILSEFAALELDIARHRVLILDEINAITTTTAA